METKKQKIEFIFEYNVEVNFKEDRISVLNESILKGVNCVK